MLGIGDRPVYESARDGYPRVQQISAVTPHRNSLPQLAARERGHRLSAGNGHRLHRPGDGPIVGELIGTSRQAKRWILREVRATEQAQILRAFVEIRTAFDRAGRRTHSDAWTTLAPIANKQIVTDQLHENAG